MKIRFIVTGKTGASYLQEAIKIYENRLKHYVSFEMLCLPDVKNAGNMSAEQLKVMEGRRILEKIGNDDTILLDERGTTYSSMEFASLLSKKLNAGTQSLTFVVGGVYGFSAEVYDRAPVTVSLSRMTFTHQMVRLVFVEQLYRAFTILRGEAYHHE